MAFDDPNLPGTMKTTVILTAVSCGTEMSAVQEGVPDMIPTEMCYLGCQHSLVALAQLVEPDIRGVRVPFAPAAKRAALPSSLVFITNGRTALFLVAIRPSRTVCIMASIEFIWTAICGTAPAFAIADSSIRRVEKARVSNASGHLGRFLIASDR